jgi:hypothetical protein
MSEVKTGYMTTTNGFLRQKSIYQSDGKFSEGRIEPVKFVIGIDLTLSQRKPELFDLDCGWHQ